MRRFAAFFILAVGLCLTALAPVATAGPALLFDPVSGKILYAENIDQQWHPASLTKIMTAYIVFEDIRAGKLTLKTKIANSKAAQKQPPSKIGLPIGATLLLDTALKALIIKSANDVAYMLAETVGGSHAAFIKRMNVTAQNLGMTRTHFVNPNGLPAKAQVTTARDLAKLARAMVKHFPEHAHYWKTKSFRLGKIKLRSYNGLLGKFEGADGMKTGFICDSGFNMVSSATRGSTRLMAVVLGEPSGKERTLRAANLLDYGFKHYRWKTFFNTTTVNNMPMDKHAGPARSVRSTVAAYTCGNRTSARRKLRAKLMARETRRARKAAASAAATGGTPENAQAGIVATTTAASQKLSTPNK